MNSLELAYWINQTADLWWDSIGTAALQAGSVALVGLVLVTLGRRWSSSLRYGILLVLLLKFLLTPALLLWMPRHASESLTVELPTVTGSVVWDSSTPDTLPLSPEPVEPDVIKTPTLPEPQLPEPAVARHDLALTDLIGVKGWCWLAQILGSTAVVLGLLVQALKLSIWTRWRSESLTGPVERLCLEIQANLGFQGPVDLRVSQEAASPMAIHLIRPVIVLPQQTLAALSCEELRPVLAHEVAHLKRRDSWVNIVQILLWGIWWFHPVYWWLHRALRRVREECCDDMAVSIGAEPEDRYCQVLLDAARCCQRAVAGQVVLGFGESHHSMQQRIIRIMDPRVSKQARLGWAAVGFMILVGLVSIPFWRPSSSLDHPRPVSDVDFDYSPLVDMMDSLGFRMKSLQSLSDSQFQLLEDCVKEGRKINSSHNEVSIFTFPETRDALLDLHDQMSDSFYAEFLLSQWHQMNQEPNEATRWMAQAMEHAPTVLVRKYELLDGRPLAHTPVGRLGVEYRFNTPTQRNTCLVLEYINLVTDAQGQVYLPGFGCTIRCNGVETPKGYDIETGWHGYLAQHARYNRLPTLYAWPKGVRKPATTLPTSEFYDYRHAVEAQGLQHLVGVTTFSIDRCYRAGSEGQVTVTDGVQVLVSPDQTQIPSFEAHTDILDQAEIHIARNTPQGSEILQVRVFDHCSRGLLTEYHVPASYRFDGNNRIALYSVGQLLPERVDVWFWTTHFSPDQGKQILMPKIGSTVEFKDYLAELRDLQPSNRRVQAAFAIQAKTNSDPDRYARVAVVTQSGDRLYSDLVIRSCNSVMHFDFDVALDEIHHFELLPIGQERCFYFDGVLLPERQGAPLEQRSVWTVEVPIGGKAGTYQANFTDSMKAIVTVIPDAGDRGEMTLSSSYSGMDDPLARQHSWWILNRNKANTDNGSTLVCEVKGILSNSLKIDVLNQSGDPLTARRQRSRSGNIVCQSHDIPVEQIQGIQIRLFWEPEY